MRNPCIKTSRLIMCALTLVALYLSSSDRGILDLMLMANNVYVCAVVAPVFAAVFSSRPLNRTIIVATIVLCSLIALWAECNECFEWTLAAFVLSVTGTAIAVYFRAPQRTEAISLKS